MTDYEEEQRIELEALESIYSEELEVINQEKPICFQIAVKSQLTDSNSNCDEEEVPGASCMLKFSYTDDYPDSLPLIEVVDPEDTNLEEDDVDGLLQRLKQEGEENLGMAMIFSLVSVALEWLTDNHEEKRRRMLEEKERRVAEAEEAERKRFEGTRVTVETFLAWKSKFDAELAEIKRLESKNREEKSAGSTLTGKQLFQMNSDLDDSDINFLGVEDGGGGGGAGEAVRQPVQVDETLFQDLDDLDFDDDDDDEDYDPALDN